MKYPEGDNISINNHIERVLARSSYWDGNRVNRKRKRSVVEGFLCMHIYVKKNQ